MREPKVRIKGIHFLGKEVEELCAPYLGEEVTCETIEKIVSQVMERVRPNLDIELYYEDEEKGGEVARDRSE